MKILFFILLFVFVGENLFLYWLFGKDKNYYVKRHCHFCEMTFSKKEIREGLKNCLYCGNPLSSWADYFESENEDNPFNDS